MWQMWTMRKFHVNVVVSIVVWSFEVKMSTGVFVVIWSVGEEMSA